MRKILIMVLAAAILGGCSIENNDNSKEPVFAVNDKNNYSITIKNNSRYFIKILVLDYYNMTDNEFDPYPLKDSFELKGGESHTYTTTSDVFFFGTQHKSAAFQNYEWTDDFYASKISSNIYLSIENDEDINNLYKLIFPDSWNNFRPK